MFKKLLPTALLVVLLPLSWAAAQNTGTVTGKVTDAKSGEPLPGANVVLQEVQRGASTNASGDYTINNVPYGRYTLSISYIGYQEFQTRITVDQDEVSRNIKLKPSVAGMEELVVVGFGEMSRKDVTSSISSVSSDELENTHLNTFENALQGNTSGVQVTQAGGTLGSPVAVRIRGTSSINANSQPLYVVDGVPITQGNGSVGNDVSGVGVGTNPLINLNPDDIESIEVLKDAAASAIYGSRGSNGVVLITTKSGRPGETQVNVTYSAGITEATDSYDMLNGRQFNQMWNDAGVNWMSVNGYDALLNNIFGENKSAREWWFTPSGNAALFGTNAALPQDDIKSTDWMDLVQRQGSIQKLNASVSGGNQQTQYYLSGSFRGNKGYMKGNKLERFAARLKIDHQISEDLRVGLNLAPTYSRNFKRSERNQVDAPITYAALYFPNVAARNDQGEPNLSVDPNPFQAFPGTPLSNLQGTQIQSNLNQTVISSNLSWDILSELRFDTDISVDLFDLRSEEKRSDITTDGFGVGTGYNLSQNYVNYNWNATLTYVNDFDKHSIDALVGTSVQRSENHDFDVSGNGFASNDLKTLNSAASITGGTGSISSFAFMGYFGRVTYSFDEKYILTLNGRIDGSSRFGADYRYGFFPAASVGWVISDEDFLQDSNTLSFLKLRASYGVTGNADGIGNYPSLALAGSGDNYAGTPGLSPSQLPNPELKWEKAKQLDVGLDYGFFNNRLRGSINYFDKETTDLLLNRPISATNGFTSFTQNEGAMRNYGLEFELTANILNGPVQWTSTFNISFIENEVKKLIGGEDIINGEQLVREGEPLGSFYLREYAGANPDDGMAAWYLNHEPSQAELDNGVAFKNKSRFGDRYVTTNYGAASRIIAGDPFADYYGGFTNTFRYKGLDLRVFLQYNVGNEIYRADGEFTDTNLSSLFNQATRQMDYWKKPGDITDVPKPILLTPNGSQTSTRYLEDGSYLRLKNVTLGYTLPTEWTPGYQIRFFAMGTNLFTVTNPDFHGMDPEVTTAPSDNINQGNIFFAPAQSRSIQGGIDLTF